MGRAKQRRLHRPELPGVVISLVVKSFVRFCWTDVGSFRFLNVEAAWKTSVSAASNSLL